MRRLASRFVWWFWSTPFYERYLDQYKFYVRIPHPTVYLAEFEIEVDQHVYPVLVDLWAHGIKTFFSCQGGPSYQRVPRGEIISERAYVLVNTYDAPRVCELLKFLNPKKDWMINDENRTAVRFDPSEAAQNIDIPVNESFNQGEIMDQKNKPEVIFRMDSTMFAVVAGGIMTWVVGKEIFKLRKGLKK